MQDMILEYGGAQIKILPPMRGSCPICAAMHEEQMPHNRNSLYYQMRFYQENRRFPTWKDAMAHCTEEMQAAWREALRRMGLMPGEEEKNDGPGMDSCCGTNADSGRCR